MNSGDLSVSAPPALGLQIWAMTFVITTQMTKTAPDSL